MRNDQGNDTLTNNKPNLDSDGIKKSGEFVDMDGVSRRRFLKVMGASVALTGAGVSCRQPEHKILPYAKMPEMLIPGQAKFFASALQIAGFARPVLVETHEHRPTKLEGSPDHPQSQGATDVFTQASVLDLYDPDRSKSVLSGGAASTWKNFTAFSKSNLKKLSENQGEGLVFLSESNSSGTFYRLRKEIANKFPKARWFGYDAINSDTYLAASQRVFGKFTQVQYDFKKADVILSIDSNFFE